MDGLARVVQRLKANTARRARALHPMPGPVWAKGYHDRALRLEDDLLAAGRYIVQNPVRAGLVRRVGDYPFWDAVWI